MAELLLDPAIRLWVILPIVIITFLVGIIRHYLSMLLQSKKDLDLLQVSDSQALMRSRNLRENAKYIPYECFEARRHFFNDEEEGYFKTQDRKGPVKNPISDPTMMVDMAKGNITNVLPMILIGGWINWHYSGFITTKVPFPLTLRFKAMLQRGIDLTTLDASWNETPEFCLLLKNLVVCVSSQAEWEALEIVCHEWSLENVEEEMMEDFSPTDLMEDIAKDKYV
ncbi:ER membrane protein complex subunit 3-like [Stylophora pistillata]|nr:ER membrane protein complex subunit 3-like [Stylophora pistillata]